MNGVGQCKAQQHKAVLSDSEPLWLGAGLRTNFIIRRVVIFLHFQVFWSLVKLRLTFSGLLQMKHLIQKTIKAMS